MWKRKLEIAINHIETKMVKDGEDKRGYVAVFSVILTIDKITLKWKET